MRSKPSDKEEQLLSPLLAKHEHIAFENIAIIKNFKNCMKEMAYDDNLSVFDNMFKLVNSFSCFLFSVVNF